MLSVKYRLQVHRKFDGPIRDRIYDPDITYIRYIQAI